MRLVTKDRWLLTEFTTERLMQQFNGTLGDLALYVVSHEIEQEPLDILPISNMPIKPMRYFIGEYDLFPDNNGVIGTKNNKLTMLNFSKRSGAMSKNELLGEIEEQINKAYDDCNFDAIDYLEHLLNEKGKLHD